MAGRARSAYKRAKKVHAKARKVHAKGRKASRTVSRTVKQGKSDWGKIFRQAGFR